MTAHELRRTYLQYVTEAIRRNRAPMSYDDWCLLFSPAPQHRPVYYGPVNPSRFIPHTSVRSNQS